MQKKHKVIIGAALLLASGFYAITQQAIDPSASPGTADLPSVDQSILHPLIIDQNTYAIIGPDPDRSKYDELNTPEQIHARWLTYLPVLHPSEYQKTVPLTAEQFQQQAEA